ncbi:MAG: ATP-dependent deoxyribonuclease subunit A [Candidatus Eisenbacteria bacterium]|uniref:DNA 3'-5' helicase n=1 Tax=Eiseniibacteriota bacterium TaxID=2212470 RepID=A0A538S810_UNCEI|nr:MAG: ATP-dependent deoxyribonuclease subunit A [Candidatus Eisenbacteria bacterium]
MSRLEQPRALSAERPAPVADHEARERIATDLDTTLIVEAAAGTGKTTQLIRRILAVLRSGKGRLDRMVAVTFTEVAAGEMKLRLRAEIEGARRDESVPEPERQRLTDALPRLEEARIGTIHSFCADLLRERPVEAGVDPQFEVAPEDVSDQLLDRAFDRWFERQLSQPGPGVKRILRRRSREEGPRALLRDAARALVDRRDFPAPWRRLEGFDREAELKDLMAEMADLASWAERGDPEDYFTQSLVEIARFVSEAERLAAVHGPDPDGLEARLVGFSRFRHWGWKGFARTTAGFPKQELKERRDALHERIKIFLDRAGASLAPELRDDLWPVVEDYEQLKAQAGRLDFMDLLVRARDMVRDRHGVREELQQRFAHIFVDEFQDTDPLQAEILLLLSASDPGQSDWTRVRPVPGKLFLVGDPKQSIYRFRRADVSLYEAVKRLLLAAGGRLVELTASFRSVREIQELVNATFAPVMGEQGGPSQARYVPLAPVRPSAPDQPAVVALPVPAPYGRYDRITKEQIEQSLPDAVGAFVAWLVRDSGWTVTERERPGERLPLEPRHVCLLFRRFQSFSEDMTWRYVRALEDRRIPHLLLGGGSFHIREEIETIRNALAAIERPEDELAVYAALRGPLFAFTDGVLLAWRERFGSLHPFRPDAAELPGQWHELGEALVVLRDLHRGRNSRPVADTIGRLLRATRAHAGIAIWPTGEQALANVLRLHDMARRAERNGLISFRAFVDWLADQSERRKAGEAAIFEEGAEGVRLMTVHRAKGLEFPVVILADLTANETQQRAARWVDPARGPREQPLCAMRIAGCAPPELLDHEREELDREREEAIRVLYVAATRARDLLVVPAVADERQPGWTAVLNPGIYPPAMRARDRAAPAPGCPEFGFDAVAKRPQPEPPRGSIVPGLHRPEAGPHEVVWWDPHTLEIGVRQSMGLAQQKILEADEGGVRSEEGTRAHEQWKEKLADRREAAGVPALRVKAATAVAGEGRESGAGEEGVREVGAVEIETVAAEASRPRGARFGSLVHAALASIGLEDGAAAIGAMAALHGRLLGSTPEEVAAAARTVERALQHPLLRRAAAAARSGNCRREARILHRLEDGTVVEAVCDLAFLEPNEPDAHWTVVDFKTDFELEGQLDRYRRQLALYREAIEAATGRPARAVLLRV